jgi:hypothetical protein
MTKAKHTPGPWVVGPVDDTVVTHLGADGARYIVAEIAGDYNQPDTWPIMEANARLIAAAPETAAERDKLREINAEMLAALEAVAMSAVGVGRGENVISNAARALVESAIARAKARAMPVAPGDQP